MKPKMERLKFLIFLALIKVNFAQEFLCTEEGGEDEFCGRQIVASTTRIQVNKQTKLYFYKVITVTLRFSHS